jgi:tetratricopeptide (TPR) repeat protein
MIGAALAVRGYTNQAEPLLAQAIEPLTRYGEPVEWLRCLLFYGHALMSQGHYAEGRVQLERAHARAVELNNPELLVMSYVVRCSFFRACGDWPECVRNADHGVALAEQVGNPLYASVTSGYRAWAQSYLGQAAEAAASRARALAIVGKQGKPMLLSSWFAAADCEIALNAGQYTATIENAQSLLPKFAAEGEFLAKVVTARALAVARAIHEHSELDAPMETCRRDLIESGNLVEAARTHFWWGRVGLLRADFALAQHHFSLAVNQLGEAGCAYAQAEAQRWLALCAAPKSD